MSNKKEQAWVVLSPVNMAMGGTDNKRYIIAITYSEYKASIRKHHSQALTNEQAIVLCDLISKSFNDKYDGNSYALSDGDIELIENVFEWCNKETDLPFFVWVNVLMRFKWDAKTHLRNVTHFPVRIAVHEPIRFSPYIDDEQRILYTPRKEYELNWQCAIQDPSSPNIYYVAHETGMNIFYIAIGREGES